MMKAKVGKITRSLLVLALAVGIAGILIIKDATRLPARLLGRT
jgi:hypothetical protein